MIFLSFLYLGFGFTVNFVSCVPTNYLKNVAENTNFDDFENYLPKFGDLPKYQYSVDTKVNEDDILFKSNLQNSVNASDATSSRDPKFIPDFTNFLEDSAKGYNNLKSFLFKTNTIENLENLTTSVNISETKILDNLIDESIQKNITDLQNDPEFDEYDNATTFGVKGIRLPNQKKLKNGNVTKENQEEESSEEEGNMVTSLLSAFLGGLSKPDGSIDLEALTGLLGSLSTQNPDGTYDFNGLTELLMNFLGGGEEGGGGSDLGAFIGGLAGAVLKGLGQNPPGGPKGVGLFAGKVVGGILPALSAPQPTAAADSKPASPAPIDSSSFIGGLLKGVLGIDPNLAMNSGGSKYPVIKAIISMLTKLFAQLAAGSSNSSSSSSKG